MSTKAKAVKTTQNGKEVRYIIADLDCVSVTKISGSVINSNMFGINGTFFNPSNGNLLGVALGKTVPGFKTIDKQKKRYVTICDIALFIFIFTTNQLYKVISRFHLQIERQTIVCLLLVYYFRGSAPYILLQQE